MPCPGGDPEAPSCWVVGALRMVLPCHRPLPSQVAQPRGGGIASSVRMYRTEAKARGGSGTQMGVDNCAASRHCGGALGLWGRWPPVGAELGEHAHLAFV